MGYIPNKGCIPNKNVCVQTGRIATWIYSKANKVPLYISYSRILLFFFLGICGGLGPSCAHRNGSVESVDCCGKIAYEWIEDNPLKPYCQAPPFPNITCHEPKPIPTPPTCVPPSHCDDLLRHE